MPDIHQELAIWASVETVYGALSTQTGLSAWWTPGVTTNGEVGSIARFPFSATYFKDMRITELQAPNLVRWHCLEGAEEWIGTDLSFRLTGGNQATLSRSHPEVGGQLGGLDALAPCTILDFRHDNWRVDTPMFAECSYTWGQFLRSLKLYCETGKPRLSPNVHSAVKP